MHNAYWTPEIVSIGLGFEQLIQYINRNLESFLECVAIYLTYHKDLEAAFDFGDFHEEEQIGIVTRMRKEFNNIDSNIHLQICRQIST